MKRGVTAAAGMSKGESGDLDFNEGLNGSAKFTPLNLPLNQQCAVFSVFAFSSVEYRNRARIGVCGKFFWRCVNDVGQVS